MDVQNSNFNNVVLEVYAYTVFDIFSVQGPIVVALE